jgi:hypothetical protein
VSMHATVDRMLTSAEKAWAHASDLCYKENCILPVDSRWHLSLKVHRDLIGNSLQTPPIRFRRSLYVCRGGSLNCSQYYTNNLNTESKMPGGDAAEEQAAAAAAKAAAEAEAAAAKAAKEEEEREARADVTRGLLDQTTAKQLSSSGDDAKRVRGK